MSSIFIEALAGSHFYPITDTVISGLSHAEQVARLSERGATLIQLREKVESPKQFFREAEAALRVARELGIRIIVNDRVDIALALHADGVHLGQDDLPPVAARRLLGPKAIIGYSTHNLDQAGLAVQMPIDYIAIGPIFVTSTKRSVNPPVGLAGVAAVRGAAGSLPVVAIGGITLENADSLLRQGASAVALISDLWPQPSEFSKEVAFSLGKSN
jgi:thiamine-phosphate pyrophosphorylase